MLDWLYLAFVEPLASVSVQKGLIGASLVAIVSAVLGCFVVLRGMAFLGDALAHAMLAGVTAGYLLMKLLYGGEAHGQAMLVGSVIAALTTVSLIGFVSRSSRIKDDTAIGIMYTGVFALGGILASVYSKIIHLHLYDFMVGNVLDVRDSELWVMAWVTVAAIAVVLLFYRELKITSFDPVMAASIGVPAVAVYYLLMGCMSMAVVTGVKIVGVVQVVGLLVTPAATAYLLCDRLSRMIALSATFGLVSVIVGIYLSAWFGNWPPGAAIVLAGTVQFLIVLVVAPQYGLLAGWARRRWSAPRKHVEDILGVLGRAGGSVAWDALYKNIQGTNEQVRRAVRHLDRQELVRISGNSVALTDAGQREALRFVRAHRLWEAYLDRVGAPATELHERAHHLEHVSDQPTLDYLDDMLGHPLHDPHGSVIPEDLLHRKPGAAIQASMLREGRKAQVETVGPAASETVLRPEMIVSGGPRGADGHTWTLVLEDGRVISLGHQAADAVTLKVLEESGPKPPQ